MSEINDKGTGMNNDTISRAEVHDLLATWLSDKLDEKTREVLEVIDGKVEDMPSITPKQRTGHWIECEDEVKCFCSECKEISDYPTKFCPNCGAKMVEPQESKKVNCKSTKCENCINHNYCDYEPQESEEI